MAKIIFYPVMFVLLFSAGYTYSQFKLGNEALLNEYAGLLKDKRVALITNKTGVTSNGKFFYQELLDNNINVVKIFTPEHGFSANDIYYEKFNIPVISLYETGRSFPKSDVDDVDVIIFDIQDLGARFYTYTSTLYLTMRDAFKFHKEYIICDRPSMPYANISDGFMLEDKFSSFVGMIPTPVVYGMTIGELGKYLKDIISADYEYFFVIPMKNYTRRTNFEDLKLKWINPSPNITSLESARIYPALCFLEGTNISEGRGTETPFQVFGAPFCNNNEMFDLLNNLNLPGVKFEKTVFTPDSKISSYEPKFMNRECYGIKIIITDFFNFKPVEISVAVLLALKNSCREFKWINNNYIDKLAGTDKLRKMINGGKTFEDIKNSWKGDLDEYGGKIKKYLIYE